MEPLTAKLNRPMQNLDYDSAFAELQQILQELQENTVSVESLTQKIKRAGELLHFCQDKLRKTEDEIEQLFSKEA